jgi:hypothetical protein
VPVSLVLAHLPLWPTTYTNISVAVPLQVRECVSETSDSITPQLCLHWEAMKGSRLPCQQSKSWHVGYVWLPRCAREQPSGGVSCRTVSGPVRGVGPAKEGGGAARTPKKGRCAHLAGAAVADRCGFKRSSSSHIQAHGGFINPHTGAS